MTPNEMNVAVELAVFGDDLGPRTDEEISAALSQIVEYNWQRTPHGECVYKITRTGNEYRLKIWKEHCRDSLLRNMWIWNNRQNQTWQSDIEAHVAAWRRPARNFCGDLNLTQLVEDALQNKLAWTDYIWELGKLFNLDIGLIINDRYSLQHQAWKVTHATAPQRVEAALRTIGAWKE